MRTTNFQPVSLYLTGLSNRYSTLVTLLAVFYLFGMILVFVVAVGVGVAGIMIKRGTMSTKVFRLMNKGGKESLILFYLCPSAYSCTNKPRKKTTFFFFYSVNFKLNSLTKPPKRSRKPGCWIIQTGPDYSNQVTRLRF